ncbi:DEAD/DEAH box helicase, putative [Plasmodium malariae]|uniref:ATP-dependent RNA helicase n=1 Tax=Plasmodium malariae TaxID=5858 RepID=A0A1A8W0G8_PLAMA|nr:DEAD/DEAH box helicase, putative [Plasmodium malariae]
MKYYKWLSLWSSNKLTKKTSFLFYAQQNKFSRIKRKVKSVNGEKNIYFEKKEKTDKDTIYLTTGLIDEKCKGDTNKKTDNQMGKQNLEDNKNEEIKKKKKYEQVRKKLYKKYNYYEIESDPHNICKHDKAYENINELNIHKMLLLGLKKMHIYQLNQMQLNTFLTIQQGKDVIINYPDGSGKTIAYLLPILNNLYFVHDYLEQIILNSYNDTTSERSICNNLIVNNYKCNNNFNVYDEMSNYLLKYTHYKNHVFFEDNTLDINDKMKKDFHLLPPSFDEHNENVFILPTVGRRSKKKKLTSKRNNSNSRSNNSGNNSSNNRSNNSRNSNNARSVFNSNSASSGFMDASCVDLDQNTQLKKVNNISIINKLIEIIKINNVNLSNLNSDNINRQELEKLDNILKYHISGKKESNCEKTANSAECIYRYLTLNPLQINKSVIILTINKDNISQIVNVIKQLDVLDRINVQTLNDVPYVNSAQGVEKAGKEEEEEEEYIRKNHFDLENLQVENVKRLNNSVLCNDQIMWACSDIIVSTPDIFLNSYKDNRSNNNILPSIIIFDEIDMLFQNNAYRNTMMNIFHIIKKRPEIYNPHVDISNQNIENINETIERMLINREVNYGSGSSYNVEDKKRGRNSFDSLNSNFSPSANLQHANCAEAYDETKTEIPQVKKTNGGISSNENVTITASGKYHGEEYAKYKNNSCSATTGSAIAQVADPMNNCYQERDYSKGVREKKEYIPLNQLIYVCSTLPSVGHTTAGSMLAERFNHLIEIVCKGNYKIAKNICTQWVELNREKILNLYLYNSNKYNNDNNSCNTINRSIIHSSNRDNTIGSANLKDFSLSSRINELENSSFEHRLDILIYILKKYHEQTLNFEVYQRSEYSEHSHVDVKKNEKEVREEQVNEKNVSEKQVNEKKRPLDLSSKKKFSLIDKYPIYKTIVFVNSIKDCIKIFSFLKKHNWPVFSFHKNLSLNSRIQNLHKFYYSKVGILITTDLLSRGIDTKNIDHVINFHFPSDAITYIHRLGKMNRLNSHTSSEYGRSRISGNMHTTYSPNGDDCIDDNDKNDKNDDCYNENEQHDDQNHHNVQLTGRNTPSCMHWVKSSQKKVEKMKYHNEDLTDKRKKKKKNFLVTNFISTSNLPLAHSIRNYNNNDLNLLSLFSRKKSFKMKIKRNNDETNKNKYIYVDSVDDVDLDINNHRLNTLLHQMSETNDHRQMNNGHLEGVSSCASTQNNAYVQAPFTVFSLEDDDEEEDDNDSDDKNDDNDKNNDHDERESRYPKAEWNSGTLSADPGEHSIQNSNENAFSTGVRAKNVTKKFDDFTDDHTQNSYTKCTQEYTGKNKKNKLNKIGKNHDNHNADISCNHVKEMYEGKKNFDQNKPIQYPNLRRTANLTIPSWDDVKFDHKKFVVERFKSKDCYLVSQVKRGKLILNNFDNNNDNEDELLF